LPVIDAPRLRRGVGIVRGLRRGFDVTVIVLVAWFAVGWAIIDDDVDAAGGRWVALASAVENWIWLSA